jgi:hypothetical protein
VKLITDSGEQELTLDRKQPETLDTAVRLIQENMHEGAPVLLENFSFSDLRGVHNEYKRTVQLFFTDGTLTRDGREVKIGTQGERQKARVTISYKSDLGGQKIITGNEEPMISTYIDARSPDIILPWFNASPDMHDQAFHPEEAPRLNLSGAETIQIITGQKALSEYESQLNLVKFGAAAIKFEIPPFYTFNLHHLHFKEYDHHNMPPPITDLRGITMKATMLNTISILLDSVRKPENNRRLEDLATLDLTYFKAQFDSYRKTYHIIENTDIPITNGFSANLYCFVKFNRGLTYILPSERHKATVEEALSPENVKKYFPGPIEKQAE